MSARGPVPLSRGVLAGLLAAVLFGLSAPVAKVLLGSVSPLLLAGVLYAGAVIGLGGYRLLKGPSEEAKLTRGDVPLLAAISLLGGVLGPVLMLTGLRRVSALSGSLLLNLEAPFTILLAVLFFREHLGRLGTFAAFAIIGGGALLG